MSSFGIIKTVMNRAFQAFGAKNSSFLSIIEMPGLHFTNHIDDGTRKLEIIHSAKVKGFGYHPITEQTTIDQPRNITETQNLHLLRDKYSNERLHKVRYKPEPENFSNRQLKEAVER